MLDQDSRRFWLGVAPGCRFASSTLLVEDCHLVTHTVALFRSVFHKLGIAERGQEVAEIWVTFSLLTRLETSIRHPFPS